MKLKPSLDAEKCGFDHEREQPAREKTARLVAFGGAFVVCASATGCRGRTGGTGSVYAIEAAIAVACTAESGTINASSKQLGTP